MPSECNYELDKQACSASPHPKTQESLIGLFKKQKMCCKSIVMVCQGSETLPLAWALIGIVEILLLEHLP